MSFEKAVNYLREKEEEDLLPDDSLRDGIDRYGIIGRECFLLTFISHDSIVCCKKNKSSGSAYGPW